MRAVAGFNEFVAGCEDGNKRAANAREHGVTARCREQDVARGEARAGFEYGVAFVKILGARADVGAFDGRRMNADSIFKRADVFLDDDRVGAVGKGCAGKDAHRVAGTDAARVRPAGRTFPGEFQIAGNARDVGGAHRIAVHGGRVEGGMRQGGREIVRECAPRRLEQGDLFGLKVCGAVEHAGERVCHGHEGGCVGGAGFSVAR